MRKKLLNNIGIKILSVLAAIIIWILVANVDDYMVTKTITGVQVSTLNEDSITELDKVYELDGDGEVTIIVKGQRSIVEELTAQDFTATVDLSQLSLTNAVQVIVEPVKESYKSALTITCPNNMISVTLEDRMEQQIAVTIQVEGEPKDGYAVGTKSTSPNMVTISGAESIVKRVKTVQVSVDVSGASDDVSVVAKLTYLNEDGDKLSSKKINANVDSVDATVEIVRTKEVPVSVETVGTVASGYSLVDVKYQPTTIMIAGKDDALSGIDELEIHDVRITGISEDEEITVNVSDYLPDGVTVADDTEQIAIQIMVEPVVTEDFVLLASRIIIQGKQDGYSYQMTGFTYLTEETAMIHIEGIESLMEGLTLSDLAPYVDVSDLQEGEYDLDLDYILPDGLSGSCNTKIHIVVTTDDGEETKSGTETE